MCGGVILVAYIATVIAATMWMNQFYNTDNYDINHNIQFEIPKFKTVPTAALENMTKCDLSKDCPLSHFAVRIKSGAADAVGPTICFDGHIVMSHSLRNVQPGLNMVQVNGESKEFCTLPPPQQTPMASCRTSAEVLLIAQQEASCLSHNSRTAPMGVIHQPNVGVCCVCAGTF